MRLEMEGVSSSVPPTQDPLNGFSSPSKNRAEAIRLLGLGEITTALHYLNLCLDNNQNKNGSHENGRGDQLEAIENGSDNIEEGILSSDELGLLEKRCLIHMKLQHYDDVLNDARRILDKRPDYTLAYKCLLVALCKTNRLKQVNDILKLWGTCSPQDLDMMECRTKLGALLLAVKNGIEPHRAFSELDKQLGLSYDWLLERKSQDPIWKHRPLPRGTMSLTLCLPFRFGHCSLGAKCPDAHGSEELEEWKRRAALRDVTTVLDSIKMDSSKRYIKALSDRLNEATDPCLVISETLPDDMKIKCPKPLDAVVKTGPGMKAYKWTFAVETKKPLTHVCLLYDIHRDYFFISSTVIFGANNKVDLVSSDKDNEVQVVEVGGPTAVALTGKKSSSYTYKVDVDFKPNIYGTFRQTVVFDYGEDIKAVRHITVEVVAADDNTESTPNAETDGLQQEASLYNAVGTWNFGNAEIVDGFKGEKVAANKIGFALIPTNKTDVKHLASSDSLNKEEYKERMRYFLTQEERARQEILAKYNLKAMVTLMESFEMTSGFNEGMTRYSVDGALFGKMTLFRDVSEDTAVGRLILRGCNYLLLTKTEKLSQLEEGQKPKVYLCPITDKTKNNIFIDIGAACVNELQLKSKDVVPFDIQFQLDRTAFIEMKAVIDKLEDFHLRMLFPDFSSHFHIPWTPIKQWEEDPCPGAKLNPRQKEALIAITSESPGIPPILVIGPFGTGKTFTLAQCIKKLLTFPNSRVMVCTHSNSAADLYIKEYLDPLVQEGFADAKPLRIYYYMRNLNSVHPDVLQYCLVENLRFRPPRPEEIMAHKVIVVTLSTSYTLMQMNLPSDTFSHIFLDEAAQAMESEAITPLICAGPNTKLVLAGDHMQLSPELFSEEAKSLHPSLLERLHNYYPNAHPCKLMLCENYRSHTAIIDYVSEAFYSKRLECSMVQPVHDNFYPLTFFCARGEEVQDKDSTSYYNMAEVFEIVDKIAKLVSSWPRKWGSYRHESAIGVLTPYSDQVSRIRSALRKKSLSSVSVERVLNVQGKQFRVVFLSTVRSFRPWVKILPEGVGSEIDLGFFSNPKLLNTALTRAQSLVAVVGDAVSLCSEGKCRNLWKDFINICHANKSLHGISYTQLEQNILGLEMRATWGLNPLADVFEPKERSKGAFALALASATSRPNQGAPLRHSPEMVQHNINSSPTPPGLARMNQMHQPIMHQPPFVGNQPPLQYAPAPVNPCTNINRYMPPSIPPAQLLPSRPQFYRQGFAYGGPPPPHPAYVPQMLPVAEFGGRIGMVPMPQPPLLLTRPSASRVIPTSNIPVGYIRGLRPNNSFGDFTHGPGQAPQAVPFSINQFPPLPASASSAVPGPEVPPITSHPHTFQTSPTPMLPNSPTLTRSQNQPAVPLISSLTQQSLLSEPNFIGNQIQQNNSVSELPLSELYNLKLTLERVSPTPETRTLLFLVQDSIRQRQLGIVGRSPWNADSLQNSSPMLPNMMGGMNNGLQRNPVLSHPQIPQLPAANQLSNQGQGMSSGPWNSPSLTGMAGGTTPAPYSSIRAQQSSNTTTGSFGSFSGISSTAEETSNPDPGFGRSYANVARRAVSTAAVGSHTMTITTTTSATNIPSLMSINPLTSSSSATPSSRGVVLPSSVIHKGKGKK